MRDLNTALAFGNLENALVHSALLDNVFVPLERDQPEAHLDKLPVSLAQRDTFRITNGLLGRCASEGKQTSEKLATQKQAKKKQQKNKTNKTTTNKTTKYSRF